MDPRLFAIVAYSDGRPVFNQSSGCWEDYYGEEFRKKALVGEISRALAHPLEETLVLRGEVLFTDTPVNTSDSELRVGDKVRFKNTGSLNGLEGVITHRHGNLFSVAMTDGRQFGGIQSELEKVRRDF